VPTRYRILFSARAAADLASIHQYIQRDSPQNATSVAAELVVAVDSLELLPHRYPIYQGRGNAMREVRRMPVPPFLIYYRIDDARSSVGVITIRHGKQRQPRRFS
jgi:addiction module RelE/StbE family toxin